MDKQSFYDTLGRISRHSTIEEIKTAYKTLAKHFHPDKNQHDIVGAGEKMAELNKAYEVLSDPIKRKAYDEELKKQDEKLRFQEEEHKKKEAEKTDRKQTRVYTNTQTKKGNSDLFAVGLVILVVVMVFAIILSNDDASPSTNISS